MAFPENGTNGKSRNALIVQPDRKMSEFIAAVLSDLGFTARIAPDSRKFVGEFTADTFDLLIFELYMDAVDGIEIILKLKDMNFSAKIILTVCGDPIMSWPVLKITETCETIVAHRVLHPLDETKIGDAVRTLFGRP